MAVSAAFSLVVSEGVADVDAAEVVDAADGAVVNRFQRRTNPCRVPAGAFLCGNRHKRQIVIHRIRGIVISIACWLGGSE
ncbi:hypothetical protein [Peribacillus sp. NPDC097295]|uniref:hypothetical protein n=1 Tax=Peribacillus sp. NPDC097295 TaxID=3364402 RepID=UPI00380EC2FB